MPRYEANTDVGRNITSVKLDGRELLRDQKGPVEYIQACDTDNGWVDIFETETVDGIRRLKTTEWEPAGVLGKMTRKLVIKRLTGKVEVVVGESYGEKR